MTNTNSLLFETVDERVQQNMHHPYLRVCQVQQSVSRFHFDVAHAILLAAHVKLSEIESVIEAILLLHQGLSIHDEVDIQQELNRQLYVLAGDYNSSQYYFVLARLGDVKLMAKLCEAVVRINEAKMTMIGKANQLTAEEYMQLQETIQGSLLESLAAHYLGPAGAWMSQIQSLVKAYVVNNEISKRKSPRFFTFRQAYDWLSDSLERVRTLPSNTFVGPIYNFLLEYFMPVKNTLESLNFAEGNRL